MSKQKLKVGQTVYLEPLANAARKNNEIQEAIVQSVGKKYFTANGMKFNLDDGIHNAGNYVSEYKAYESVQEIEEKRLADYLHKKIKDSFGAFKATHTLSELKQIAEIIKIKY